jgi:GT2 family glycosyltransferase
MFCPDSTVYHVGGGSLPKKSWKKTYLNMRNNNIMLYKNITNNRLRKVFLARLFLDGIAAIKFLFDGGFMDMFAVVKAHWKFFSLIPELRRERWAREPQAVTKIYQKNLVYEYFLLRKKTFRKLRQDLFS